MKNDNDEKTLFDFIPNYPNKGKNKTFVASAGKKLDKISKIITMDDIIAVLENIHDPEIPVNIYELGLIYDIKILDKNDIKIKMSLTSPGCPVAGEMPFEVAQKINQLKEAGEVKVELVWDPPWSPERMSEDAKLALDYR